ncbi:hypothetical protein VNO78_26930 [Psophocarpus tetragonolobus]|uniref:Uncharacterized protein n=1 Tax=Psophocarpus tetragonolobus TaxID=3891 RepID=A0AAN9S063_PSOTE
MGGVGKSFNWLKSERFPMSTIYGNQKEKPIRDKLALVSAFSIVEFSFPSVLVLSPWFLPHAVIAISSGRVPFVVFFLVLVKKKILAYGHQKTVQRRQNMDSQSPLKESGKE